MTFELEALEPRILLSASPVLAAGALGSSAVVEHVIHLAAGGEQTAFVGSTSSAVGDMGDGMFAGMTGSDLHANPERRGDGAREAASVGGSQAPIAKGARADSTTSQSAGAQDGANLGGASTKDVSATVQTSVRVGPINSANPSLKSPNVSPLLAHASPLLASAAQQLAALLRAFNGLPAAVSGSGSPAKESTNSGGHSQGDVSGITDVHLSKDNSLVGQPDVSIASD